MGVIGDIAGIVGNESARDRGRSAIKAQQRGLREATELGQDYYSGLSDQFGADSATYGQDLQAYRNNLGQMPSEMGEYDMNIDVNKYMDPAVQYRQDQERRQIEQSAANRGGMFSGSGATAKALQDRSQAIASDEFGNAYNRGYQDRTFGYNDFLNRIRQGRENEAIRRQNLQSLLSQSGGARAQQQMAQGMGTQLGMGQAQGIGNLEANLHNLQGQYYQGLANNVGSLTENTVKAGMDMYTGGQAGGGGMLSGLFKGGSL